MGNRLEENAQSEHAELNYGPLLQAILAELKKPIELFKLSGDKQRLTISLDFLAQTIANTSLPSPILGSESRIRSASVNFDPDFQEKFPHYIQQIRESLLIHLNNYCTTENFQPTQLLSNLEDFRNTPSQDQNNFIYPFPNLTNLSQQHLEIKPQAKGSDSALKLHKLTINVHNLNTFAANFRQSLENYIDRIDDGDEDTRQELKDILAENKDYEHISQLINKEILGQLKREAGLKYLEYLVENIPESKYTEIIYLQDLIRRLKLFKQFFNNNEVGDDHYKINYDGYEIDLKFLLAQANAFDSLPIIPIVTGYLGETSNYEQDYREFIFGLKLKLNGKIEKEKGKTVFRYNIDLFNPDSQIHQEELEKEDKRETFYKKVLYRFCLYYFVFASRCQPDTQNYYIGEELEYNPIETFEKYFDILKGNNQEKKSNLLKQTSKGLLNEKLKIETKITKLSKLLKKFLGHGTIVPPTDYPVHIEIKEGILESDSEEINIRESFLKNKGGNPKLNLRYINVGEATMNPDALCQLTAKFTIEDIRYHLHPEKQIFNMEYDLTDLKTLPIIFAPRDAIIRQNFSQNFAEQKLIIFPYNTQQNLPNFSHFNYCFTFFLLTYICLKLLTDEITIPLFLPILRLHLQSKNTDNTPHNLESQIAEYSKVLAHMLNMEHLANSQGLNVKQTNQYKTKNAFNSIYSVIPKNFSFNNPQDTPTLDKVALIVINSRDCDESKDVKERSSRIANLFGQIITMNLLPSGKVQIKLFKSLSANYTNEQMYSEPTIILDAVTNLYHLGYRHIFYLAKTPYTQTLHLSKSDDSENLFFLSKDIIKYIHQDYQDLYIYPLFFEQYYVRKVKTDLSESLSLQDSRQLRELFNDPNQKAVVIFNLFNGLTVKTDGSFYNGVISYSTLVGIYQDLFDDQYIRQNLLYNEGKKNDLLQYLTLLHFSRYEKASGKISLKLNPYKQIIDSDESVSKLSVFKHVDGKADFNLLAFLTEVRLVLSTPRKSNEQSK